MQAFAIVTLTLAGLASLLFGSDYLDRRLLVRSGQPLPDPAPAGTEAERPDADAADRAALAAGPGEAPAAPASPAARPDRLARPARVTAPAPACRHWRERRRGRAPQVRHSGGHGPLAVTPERWGALVSAAPQPGGDR